MLEVAAENEIGTEFFAKYDELVERLRTLQNVDSTTAKCIFILSIVVVYLKS